MNELLQLSEQVWIPVVSIRRISKFGGTVAISYFDGSVEKFDGEDAERILKQIEK